MKNISISATRSQLSAETSPAFHGSFMGGEEEEEECGLKKRRLGVEQVKELERSFEEQNRLEPQMKIKLAKELGLQPRQIAIWFQNRRARWKTKKLEREYEQLRADYEVLKHHFQVLQRDKEKLVAELNQLRAKVSDEKRNSRGITETIGGNCAEGNFVNFRAEAEERSLVVTSSLGDLRDGSESDSSGNNSPHRRTTTGIVSDQYGSSLRLGYPGEGSDFGLQIPPENRISGNQLLRLEEEHGFVNPDGCVSIFGEEQLSAFPWVWPEHWTQ